MTRCRLAAALCLLIPGVLPAAEPLGGASPPRPVTLGRPPQPEAQYKRVGQWALKRILEERHADAIRYLDGILEQRPDDSEAHFLLAAAHAQSGDLEAAERSMQAALDRGLPPGRWIAGPREVLAPLRQTETFRRVMDEHGAGPVHGPMVGAVDDRSARVWVRTARPAQVSVVTSSGADFAEPSPSSPVSSTAETDFTAVVRIDGLKPETRYHYRVSIDGRTDGRTFTFRTFPPRGGRSKFSIAFGGGAGWVPEHEHVWNTIRDRAPAALLLLGDNVYSDDPETPAMQRYCYYRRQSRPEFRGLAAHTPVFAIWDDHDFSTDDSWGGPHADRPAWKRDVWNTFRQNWVNPSYAGAGPVFNPPPAPDTPHPREESPGVWFDFAIGDVDFFMLDGRCYRTDAGRFGGPGVPNPTMLGPVQKQWLKERLAASTATFKVLVSPVPWDFRAKPGRAGLDTWRGYAQEREEIFSFLEDNGIEGVVLLSADRHRSDAWKIERPDGYDLYEFNSSRLTNQHTHPTMDEALFSYNAKPSFGLVTFDTAAMNPAVTYEVVAIDGETVHSLPLRRSTLRGGRRTLRP